MSWSDFYLACFIVGFSLSALSFLAGAVHVHLPFRIHLPFHIGHSMGGHGAGGHGGHGAGKGATSAHGHLSWFNASTAMAFLAWFGGIGYILATKSQMVAMLSLAIAVGSGLFAAYVVFRFMVKLMGQETAYMRDEDYRVEGAVGTISVPVRENGIGEVTYLLGGVRRSAGARSEDGKAIPRDAEVVVERVQDGIAYVKRWEEFTK